jgi:hypothetical protein
MIDKIKDDITERSIKKNFSLLPNQGKAEHQYDYRICKSELEDLEGYYFVVSKIIQYNGVSIDDYGYVVYVYDKNGDFVNDDSIQQKCKGKFFESLINAE